MEITTRLNPESKDVFIEIDFKDFIFTMKINLDELEKRLRNPLVRGALATANLFGMEVSLRRAKEGLGREGEGGGPARETARGHLAR